LGRVKKCEIGGFVVIGPQGSAPTAYVAYAADADLYIAAPDLLASLVEIVTEWGYPNTPKWHRAKAAIAKAEGK
jgi:hypothetical protein